MELYLYTLKDNALIAELQKNSTCAKVSSVKLVLICFGNHPLLQKRKRVPSHTLFDAHGIRIRRSSQDRGENWRDMLVIVQINIIWVPLAILCESIVDWCILIFIKFISIISLFVSNVYMKIFSTLESLILFLDQCM